MKEALTGERWKACRLQMLKYESVMCMAGNFNKNIIKDAKYRMSVAVVVNSNSVKSGEWNTIRGHLETKA